MREIKTKVYTLDELSKEAKEKAREWWKQTNDMPFLKDYMQMHLEGLLEKNKMVCSDAKIYYSLSYSQGDGAMFEGTIEYKECTFKVKQYGHYNHYNSYQVVDAYTSHENGNNLDAVQMEFEDRYKAVCKELERLGYTDVEHENSDETVDENIKANEYTFTAEGVRFG